MMTPTELREVEMSLAYERASGVIEGHCLPPADNDEVDELGDDFYLDLSSSDIDVSEEAEYLESRRLLVRHPEHPEWVHILDEGEPLTEPTEGATA